MRFRGLIILLFLHSFCYAQLNVPCNNWLNLPSYQSYVSIGDLDVPGNTITVEAIFSRTTPYSNGYIWAGDLVSKHVDPNDVNYLLRPNNAELTTTNGYFVTPPICEVQLNKVYHAAMVYDGSTLKFYRNGFLMSSVPATGNMFQNNHQTRIGLYDALISNTNLIGYINEVRIWNIVRTQAQIRAFMNTSLPNPTTQTGLLAYYTFDNLQNKQGNTAWDGTLGGSASISANLPTCNFFIDSCATPNTISNVINDYTPILALNPCANKITVEDASAFNIGDTVLMIQMKGADIDATNTATFGTITNYRNAGNYEFNYVKSKTGNIIELKNIIVRQYDIPVGKVQLVRVPYYQNPTVTSTLTCLPWDGSKGGVLVLNAVDAITLNANIDVSGKGFRGGTGFNSQTASLSCFQNDYFYPQSSNAIAGQKGESIASPTSAINYGKGSAAGGGGGGLGHNSGGGGGANGGNGGLGGYSLDACGNAPFDNRGIGGRNFTYSTAANKVFAGSGGGAGQADNTGNPIPNGGNGGGIIIITSNTLTTNGNKILANGSNGSACSTPPAADCHDGMGGGGAAGSILLNTNQLLDNTGVENKGGRGADMVGSVALGGKIGAGGGGSGGLLFLKSGSLPANVSNTNTGGANGVLIQDANNAWGATPGQNGTTLFNLTLPIATVPFKANIDSVRFTNTITNCTQFNFLGFGYTNTSPINSWQWDFGDGNTANTQNTSHTYSTNGTFTVKLVVTDINGCKDSLSRSVTAGSALDFDFTYKADVCSPLSVQFTGVGTSNQNPYWSFGDATTVTGTTTPLHLYPATGNYIVKYSLNNGSCADTVTKTISLAVLTDNIVLTTDTSICFGTTKQLRTSTSLGFCWTPATYLDNPNSPNPITSTPENITYYYTAEIPGTNIITNGNFDAGNVGFTSAYNFATPNVTEGQYFVGTSPQAWNASLSNCGDHTSGNGNMMMINGAPTPNVKVWSQTVTVTPNTNYAFSTWIQALWPPNPAQLQFSINDNDIGTLITASLPTCTWTQFYTTWNSGNNTTANISIVNKNTAVIGNDFALDDISFAPLLIKRDSVKITVDTPHVVATNSTAICEGTTIQLDATGANTYSWTEGSTLSDPNIANPIASPTGTTRYIVTGITLNGCEAKDTVDITIKPKPVITKSNNDTICVTNSIRLSAAGGVAYSWSPGASLDNPSSPTPLATPSTTTNYIVTVTGANSCTNIDSVKIFVRSLNAFSITPPSQVCKNNPLELLAEGGDIYLWQAHPSLSDITIPNPIATPTATTTYTVFINDTLCGNTTTLSTIITALPLPTIRTSKSNDINCVQPQSKLAATGAISYTWSPGTTLNTTTSPTPIASPIATTQYFVSGTGGNGCTNKDSIIVNVTKENPVNYQMPTAFTPNNDGLNDCYGIKYWGDVSEIEFSIYNRWGERVFYSKKPGDCWNGMHKGLIQDTGVFVYVIKAKTACDPVVFRKGTFALIR